MKKTFANPTTMNAVEIATLNAFRKVIVERGRNLLECMNSESETNYIDTELSDENNCCIWWSMGCSEYDHIPYITYNKVNECLMIWYSDDEGIPVLKKDYEHSFDELRGIIKQIDNALTDIDSKNEDFMLWLRLGRKLGLI